MNPDTPPPSFGVIFHPAFPPETLPDFARQAEAAGFDELWLWDDCFLPGAFTAAAVALSATQRLKVGIGLIPATVYNPLFIAMEITTLARAFPGRILPGFGFGVPAWMEQIGAAPKSYLKALDETVTVVRRLLNGEEVTFHGDTVHLEKVRMQVIPQVQPPLFIGGKRERVLRQSGRISDGTILVYLSSPAYIHWALEHIGAGIAETSRSAHQLIVYTDVKVHPDGEAARTAARRDLAAHYPWVDVQTQALGIAEEAQTLVDRHGVENLTEHIPDAWLDALTACGTPQQVLAHLRSAAQAGATSIVFQPLHGDPDCLDEYCRYLMPRIRAEW
jgi:5,10-methylenetetrahydromethanopterin reductase